MTEMDLVERLAAALDAVEQAGIPAELRAEAFAYALAEMGGAAGASQKRNESGESAAAADPDSLLATMAKRLGHDLEVIAHVFEQEGEDLHLIVSKAQLPHGGSRAGAMRDVALLLSVGRQAAGLEDYTPTTLIRKECEEIGVLDSSNFSVEVARIGMRARGGAKSREVHANRHQFAQAAELMQEIAGGEGE
jgi:hypothetical protein